MNGIRTLALVPLALLLFTTSAFPHGTERHYGNSLDQRPTFTPSPAFLEVAIDSGLSRARRSVAVGVDELVQELAKLHRYTAQLARVQSDAPAFVSYSERVAIAAEHIIEAARLDDGDRAIAQLRQLARDFETVRPFIEKKNRPSK